MEIKPGGPTFDPHCFQVKSEDVELFNKHLRSFVPPDSFDAHGHWYDLRIFEAQAPVETYDESRFIGYQAYLQSQKKWMDDRGPKEGLFFPFPLKNLNTAQANKSLLQQLEQNPDCRGLLIIKPGDDPQEIDKQVGHSSIAGFKVYHCYADRPDSLFAEIGEFVPAWAWELADQHGLCITLHLVLQRALADERNQQYIRRHCLRYPNAKLILAHAARGFCSRHTLEGIKSLRGLDNVFFDTSAVCQAGAFEAVLDLFGASRLLYGSDFPVSEIHGVAFGTGDGFQFLYDYSFDWSDLPPLGQPTLIGIESLLALKQACRRMHLNDSDIERIFRTNARDLLALDAPSNGRQNQETYHRAKRLIPGGTQLLSKRPAMFLPEQWPNYYQRAKGCEVWDLSGRRLIDVSHSGVGSCPLGFADDDVNDAVHRCIDYGNMCTLNSTLEVELAELLLELHPWADKVRYARTGGEAMAVAIRIARAATGRGKIAFCGYHGWHDWYLAANLSDGSLDGHLIAGLNPAGVPRALRDSILPFQFNNIEQLEAIIAEQGQDLAAIVMEPVRYNLPTGDFLARVHELSRQTGAVLVFDEITSGWRFHCGGIHLKLAVEPDVAVFAKGMSNGYPMAAVIGIEEVMEAAQRSFISSTYWTEAVGPAAALAAIGKMRRINLPDHLAAAGQSVKDGWRQLARRHHLPVSVHGLPALISFNFDLDDVEKAHALRTLMTQEMLDRGYLASNAFYATAAHNDSVIAGYLDALDATFAILARAVQANDILARLRGPVAHKGFQRLT